MRQSDDGAKFACNRPPQKNVNSHKDRFADVTATQRLIGIFDHSDRYFLQICGDCLPSVAPGQAIEREDARRAYATCDGG